MKRWYPHEVRAIKINSKIESWGDAQGFRNYKKVFESDCHIYHYEHIRNENAYVDKMTEFFKLYYTGMRQKRKTWQYFVRSFDREKTLKYFGHHTEVMKNRIQRIEVKYKDTYSRVKGVNIVGELSKEFSQKILADEIFQVENLKDRKKDYPTVIFNPDNMQKLFRPSKVKDKSESPLCRPWHKDFVSLLKLSEKNIWSN